MNGSYQWRYIYVDIESKTLSSWAGDENVIVKTTRRIKQCLLRQ